MAQALLQPSQSLVPLTISERRGKRQSRVHASLWMLSLYAEDKAQGEIEEEQRKDELHMLNHQPPMRACGDHRGEVGFYGA